MTQKNLLSALVLFTAVWYVLAVENPKPVDKARRGDSLLADYFRAETAALADRCLADIKTLEEWKARRAEYRRQLQEMLGLWPMPERTDLKPVVTGKLEQEEFTVEKLHFQASPKLYVTANLYLPKKLEKPAPTILYLCGHSRQFKDGVSLGNKTAYQHHGAWFARNGYVCLVLDTLQLGEIEGIHHGTHRYGMWWWNSRGYTPAGVEAWFGIRALDYLCTRAEVDTNRFGITGRSGGGSYSWTIVALDDRVKVVAPVAGITDLQNQVVDGCVEGHCDCMFFVNTYRWDFPQVAALIAPRPLLLGNSDKDKIFPLDGVVRLHGEVRRIYDLYGAKDKLGLLITEGPHEDTPELQLPVFRWFNRFLKGEEPLVEMAAKKFFKPEQLKVFDILPADAVNTNIHETFVPKAPPSVAGEREPQHKIWLAALRAKVFAGWPAEDAPPDAKPAFVAERDGLRLSAWDFISQHDVRLRIYFLESVSAKPVERVSLTVLDDTGWKRWLGAVRAGFEAELADELAGEGKPATDSTGFDELKRNLETGQTALAFFAPRGIGLTAWTKDEKKLIQIRRRFMLLGQTLDAMRVWDVRCAARAGRSLSEFKTASLTIRANGAMGVNALYASLFEPNVQRLELARLPQSHADGPDYLNVLKVLDIPQALQMAAERGRLRQNVEPSNR
jgi:hypothetical protein